MKNNSDLKKQKRKKCKKKGRIEEMQMQFKMKELELEFAREKKTLFEKWLTSNEITTKFDKLRQTNSYWKN